MNKLKIFKEPNSSENFGVYFNGNSIGVTFESEEKAEEFCDILQTALPNIVANLDSEVVCVR